MVLVKSIFYLVVTDHAATGRSVLRCTLPEMVQACGSYISHSCLCWLGMPALHSPTEAVSHAQNGCKISGAQKAKVHHFLT